ncbi:MAG: hypothetical protein ABUK01_10315 [Leptospirales bacterium]
MITLLVMVKEKKFQKIILSVLETAQKDSSLEELGLTSFEDMGILFQTGGLVLNGIFKNIIDLEETFPAFGITPEVAVRLTFRLLKF